MTAATIPDALLGQDIAIVGRKGSGKTYTAKGFVERLLDAGRRVCIIDPTGIWWGLRSSADGKRTGYPVVVFGGQHADVAIAEQSGAALARLLAAKNLPAIIDLSEMLIGQRQRFMTEFAEAIYRENRTPLHLVIDEADEFAPQNPMPETKRLLHHVDRIVRRGRVRGFRVMLISQRPAVLHKNVLTQANALIAMRLPAPQDRKALQAWVEGQADVEQAKAVMSSLAGLQPGEGWLWAPEISLLERVRFPKIKTFDSSRTPDDDEEVAAPVKLAAVDLSEIQESFAAVAQEAKTLAELKADNAKLKRELEAKPKPAVDEAEVQRRVREACDMLRKLTLDRRLVDALVEQLRDTMQRALQTAVGDAHKAIAAVVDTKAPVPETKATVRATAAPVSRTPAPPRETKAAADVSGPQQRLLDALAWFEAIGVAEPRRSPLAAVAGVSPKSSGFEKNVSTLRTLGLIDYPDRGRVLLTDAGRRAANQPAIQPTEEALHEAVCRMVSGPQAVLLRILVALRGASIEREALAREASVSALSSGFEKNISVLKSFELIDYPQRGSVAATDILFPEQ